MGKLISITEYAKKHGRNRYTVIQKIERGGFKTARKIGRMWVIDEDEPYIDGRVKSGKYKGFRKKNSKKSPKTP